ncbi:MAG: LexA repressor [Patescibacteria group bacterium]|nr:MAG: LexA repressor [Patescibacteria group bacterium]
MTPVVYRRQAIILDFLKQYIQKYGVAPTLRKIAEATGVSSLSTIHEHLTNLEKQGLIKRTNRGKNIEILDEEISFSPKGVEVPVLGYIAAGLPIEPYSDPNAKIGIPPSFASDNKRVFVLQVRGDSMIEEQIRDGDYVVCEETQTAKNGDIVVALLDNGMATLKKFFKEATRIRLEPANAKMSPIFVKNVRVQGRVVGLIRKYSN